MRIDDLRPPVADGPWPPVNWYPPIEQRYPDGARTWTGVTYAMVSGFRPLVMDVHVPTAIERPPVVVWVHGGGWSEGDRRYVPLQWPQVTLFQKLIDAGLAVATIDYRYLAEAKAPACVHDAKAAVRYLRRYADQFGLDAARVGAWGESAGGHLAASLGLLRGAQFEGAVGVPGEDSAVQAVVNWYGVTDFERILSAPGGSWFAELFAGGMDELRAFNPIAHASADAPPFLHMHGRSDGLVPYEQSVVLHEALLAAGAHSELELIDGADHCFLPLDPTPLMDRSVQFLSRQLRG